MTTKAKTYNVVMTSPDGKSETVLWGETWGRAFGFFKCLARGTSPAGTRFDLVCGGTVKRSMTKKEVK